jgi:phage FluMu protein Com
VAYLYLVRCFSVTPAVNPTEKTGLRKILWLKRSGTWLTVFGFALVAIAALGYNARTMLAFGIGVFLIASVFNVLYMWSRCPRCRHLFNSLPESRLGFIWPVRRCRHCGLSLTDVGTQVERST